MPHLFCQAIARANNGIHTRSVEREKVAETKDLDESTLLDIDEFGNLCGITVEHASERANIPHFSFEQIAA